MKKGGGAYFRENTVMSILLFPFMSQTVCATTFPTRSDYCILAVSQFAGHIFHQDPTTFALQWPRLSTVPTQCIMHAAMYFLLMRITK
jgi:hypothetical protein